MESLLEIYTQLESLGCSLEPFCQKDENGLYNIYRHVVDTGGQFPYECNSIYEFHRQFFSTESKVYVCHFSKKVIGGFYIKPNVLDRSGHTANAAYMLDEGYRGQGIGALLIKASLHIAKEIGFDAMQFNRVLSQNISAIRLYQKLGFEIIGTIPEAIKNGSQDEYIMYRSIKDI